MELIVLIVLVVSCLVWLSAYRKKKRREALMLKYGDPRIVDMIMEKRFWLGQTGQQLLDSLGHPADIDEKVLKTKTKQTWKYSPTGKNRFALRITLENGAVIGWDQK